MVLLRLTTIVLVLLFLMHTFRAFSSVHANQETDGETLMSWSQEGGFGDIGSAGNLKIGLGGRKMGAEKVLEKGIMEAAGKASKISGKHNDASNMTFQDEAEAHQIDLNKLETMTLISKGAGTDLSKASLDRPSKGHNKANKGMRQKERLLSVVNELVNLLHKDYSSGSMPHMKPPIHNNEPQH